MGSGEPSGASFTEIMALLIADLSFLEVNWCQEKCSGEAVYDKKVVNNLIC